MKTAEAKISSAAIHPKKEVNKPFFAKDGKSGFFSGSYKSSLGFFNNGNIQTKLTIGQPGDIYEKEADAMADKVVQRLSNNNTDVKGKNEIAVQTKPIASLATITPFVQSKCAACEQEEKLKKTDEGENSLDDTLQKKPIFESNAAPPDDEENVQRKCAECEKENKQKLQTKGENDSANQASAAIENNLQSSKGTGHPMPKGTRMKMEDSFGLDFSHVRVHTDNAAVQMSKELHAQAFTHGSDIYFNSGKYDENSQSGKHLLAHELTHTIQQCNSGTMIQNAPGDEYTTGKYTPSPLLIKVSDTRFVEPLDIKEDKLEGQINYTSKNKTVDDINSSVKKGLVNENKDVPPVIADANEALINQLGGGLTEAGKAASELLSKGMSGWKSLLQAMNNHKFEIRLMAGEALSHLVVKNKTLLNLIVSTIETDDGGLRVAAVRVLQRAGFGSYYDNKAFSGRIIQKLEFIKIFFGDLPLPKDGPYQKIVNEWFIRTKKEMWDKADMAITELKSDTILWENLTDISQSVEIFNTGMAVVNRVLSFMKMFDSHRYTLQNQDVYDTIANATMVIGENLKRILSFSMKDGHTTASPTISHIWLENLFKNCQKIPNYIATATVNDLSIQLYKVERDSLALAKSLKDAKPPDWPLHVDRVQKVIGIANGIQSTLPKLSQLAWDKPMVYFDIWNQLLTQAGEMLGYLSAISFALNAYSLSDVIEESWQIIDKRKPDAKKNKAILRDYLSKANKLILENMDNPKALGDAIEKLRSEEQYKKALDWAEKFSVEETEHREIVLAVTEIALTVASIWAGGVAGRIAAFGIRAVATTGAVGAVVAGNVIVRGGLILAADTLGFVVTEKTLHQLLFGKGNWDTFLSDYIKAYLLFGALKGTGRLYEGLIAVGKISPLVAKIAHFGTDVAVLTTMQAAFIAWDNLQLDADTQKEFHLWEQLVHNALFLSLIKIGMLGLNKFPPGLLAKLDKKVIGMMEARASSLERKLGELKGVRLGTREAQALHKEIKNLMLARKEALQAALRNNVFKGDEKEIAATQATILSINNRIAEIDSMAALFKFNIKLTEIDSVFTFEGDPAEIKKVLDAKSATGVAGKFEKVQDATNSEIYKYQVPGEEPIYLEKVPSGKRVRPTPSEAAKLRGFTWNQVIDGFWKAVQDQGFKYDPAFIGNTETNIRVRDLMENGWKPGDKLPKEIGEWLERYYTREKPPEQKPTQEESAKNTIAGGGVKRIGTYPAGVTEVPISDLNPIHDVPRAGVPQGHIDGIAESIKADGFDVTKPASATRLPDGTLVITGGHHRIAAMKQLGETTIPTKVFPAATTPPLQMAKFLGIGRITGKYKGSYLPELNEAEKTEINKYLEQWKKHNGDQVKFDFSF